MRLMFTVAAALGVLVGTAGADEYWITYEGNDLPENEGWGRSWGNDDGQYHGHGAVRTVENGILTMDSLYDLRVYDYAYRYLYGEVDPDPGELFVAEWRVYIEDWVGDYGHWDSKVSICSDEGWLLGLGLFPDHVESQFEAGVNIPIAPDMFHDYRLLSWDMHAYELYIDGELARVGSFWDDLLSSKFSWGDCVRGAASLAHWDYVRFGVVPEPCSLLMLVAVSMAARRTRGYAGRVASAVDGRVAAIDGRTRCD
jgi:hypothetical protein